MSLNLIEISWFNLKRKQDTFNVKTSEIRHGESTRWQGIKQVDLPPN